MAFMEKPPAGKVLLDDTVPLTAVIEASQSLHSHTVRRQAGRQAEPAGMKRGRGRPGPAGLGRAGKRERSPGGTLLREGLPGRVCVCLMRATWSP